MRLAIVSDIHGNLPALEAVLADLTAARADRVVNLGDCLSGPLWPAETADRLMALGWPTLAGNHERQVLAPDLGHMGASDAHAARRLAPAHRAWLASLPTELWLADDVYACHGTPASDLHYWLETVTPDFGAHGSRGVRAATPGEALARLGSHPAAGRATLALCGHTHTPRIVYLPTARSLLALNPGSVGLPAYDDAHPHVHVIENGTPHARWALAERRGAGWHVELHATAYDWEAAARQAEANGRGDWADALRTGRMGRWEKDVAATARP